MISTTATGVASARTWLERRLILACALALLLLGVVASVAWASPPAAEMARPVCSDLAPADRGSPAVRFASQATGTATATLRATLEPIEFAIPRLLLHGPGGGLTGLPTRTLIVEVTGLEVPPGGLTVGVEINTQHDDPDLLRTAGIARTIAVTRAHQRIDNASPQTAFGVTTAFTFTFGETALGGARTPTDYFQYAVVADGVPVFDPVHYAFLMENQYDVDLGADQQGTGFTGRVYHCDMFPIGDSPGTWLPRQDADEHVRDWLLPTMQEVFHTEVITWGMGPLDEDWDDDGVLELYYGNGADWYHRRSGQVAFWGSERAIALITNTSIGRHAHLEDARTSTFGQRRVLVRHEQLSPDGADVTLLEPHRDSD
jgi:hypothetical protein